MTFPSYSRSYGFALWQAQHPSDPLPGDEVDAELDNVGAASQGLAFFLSLIQRSDGALLNGVVTPDSLSPAVLSLLNAVGIAARGAWLTTTAYAYKDLVTNGGTVYLCVIAHTSGTFATDLAAGKWMVFSNSPNQALNTSSAVTFASISTTGNASFGGTMAVTGIATFSTGLISTQNFGNTKANVKFNVSAGTGGSIFTVPYTITNLADHVKIKVSVCNDDSANRGYATEYSEWIVTYGSQVGVADSPAILRTLQVQNSTNSGVINIAVNVTASASGGTLSIIMTASSGGSTGFLTYQLSAQAELVGPNQGAFIAAA